LKEEAHSPLDITPFDLLAPIALCLMGGLVYYYYGWKTADTPLSLSNLHDLPHSKGYPIFFWGLPARNALALIVFVYISLQMSPLLLVFLSIPLTSNVLVGTMMALYLIAIPALIVHCFNHSIHSKRSMWHENPFFERLFRLIKHESQTIRWKEVFFAFLVGTLFSSIVYHSLSKLLHILFPGLCPDQPLQGAARLLMNTSSIWEKLMYCSLIGLVVPCFEEILFRGIIYSSLRQITTLHLAVIFNILLFTAAHYETSLGIGIVPILCSIAIQSYCLTLLYERSKGLFSPILFHILMNLPLSLYLAFNGAIA
jgi:membrane protease YdiL (CAAX protease family)